MILVSLCAETIKPVSEGDKIYIPGTYIYFLVDPKDLEMILLWDSPSLTQVSLLR